MSREVRVLNGRYEIDSRLGEGGMATVFGGSDRVLGRKVAVKVLARQYARDRTSVERFRREAQAAAGLNHPNVVSVFDTGSDDGVHYIVMEHVEGRTLADIIREEGALPPARAAEIAVDVCRALSSAHEKGMVHRDVKPGNVLLTPDGGVKVADFGIARVASGEPLTATGSVMGTASYLSPEQARGASIDARSDIYSLGCVLYEMLTGQTPFAGDTPVSIAYKHVEEQPTAPTLVNPAVPEGLEAVVTKAMAKDPADRFQSATQMARDLREAAPAASAEPAEVMPTGERTAILPVSPEGPASTAPLPLPASREQRRRWWPFAAAATGLAALGVVLALTVGRESPLPTASPTPPPSSPSPSPTPTPTASTLPPIPTVDVAFAQFAAALGGLDPDVQAELMERAGEAVSRYADGEQEEALEKVAEIRGQVEELIIGGEILPQDADPILGAVAGLEASIEAFPAPTGDESGNGRGNGKGKGKEKGHGDED
jgi:eukaryotic-like serine/threonine-protein kinase